MRTAVGVLLGTLREDDHLVVAALFWGTGILRSAAIFTAIWPYRRGDWTQISTITHEDDEARGLLSKALNAVTSPDECWWLLLQTACHGNEGNVKRALDLLPYSESFELASAHRMILQARLYLN